MNKIAEVFQNNSGNVLNVYCTAGYPNLEDTGRVLKSLQSAGVDLIEIGMPFSDPIADGGTIQDSNGVALNNGMTIEILLEQLEEIKDDIHVPIILMGYLNPVMQFGIENFLSKCRSCGVSGLILPDLPIKEFVSNYESMFSEYEVENIFLVTPQTSMERVAEIDKHTMSFIYAVSTYSTTGGSFEIDDERVEYFNRLRSLQLRNPFLIGFGIHDYNTFSKACEFGDGAIIGSAFIKAITNSVDLEGDITNFVKSVKGEA